MMPAADFIAGSVIFIGVGIAFVAIVDAIMRFGEGK